MIQIPLTQGKVAIIDEADYSIVNKYKWHYMKCGREGKYGYASAVTGYKNGHARSEKMHRLICGAEPQQYVDHINGNCLDNRRSNLRICSIAENARNQHSRRGISKFKGVTWRRDINIWQARIRINYECIHLGFYKDESEAAKAYDKAAMLYFGEFANINFKTI